MGISLDDVEYIARLARLSIPDEQQEELKRQLNDILEYMDHLRELDTEDVEPLEHVLEVSNVVRPDQTAECLQRRQALENAPDTDGKYFRVPGVVDKADGSSEGSAS